MQQVAGAPPLTATGRDLEIQAIAIEHPHGFGSGLGVSRDAVGEGHLGGNSHAGSTSCPPVAPPEVNGKLRPS